MSTDTKNPDLNLVCIIVNFGLGSKVLQTAKKHGMRGGTVLLGKGTIKNHLLELLAINDVKKEIVLMGSDRKTVNYVLEKLDQKFKFSKPNHGIAFTTSINRVIGARSLKSDHMLERRGADQKMYHAITVIIEKGNAEDVIDAASEAGSKGGTIINGRGSGIHETSKLFSMNIEPEKEIVMILSERDSTDAIVSSIRKKLKIDEPGNGIIFIQDINQTYGLYD
ncbi:P-II family nitrogen regulator [Tenuibacillus multivorans]|uniref:Nitrogen regulatory protein PII n=1 Tax=Tenuibacillus multivorans TaxID=237069 RepID=A0A1H0EBJ4_9BACI|nr:P-II family nitrogen regulator [Tenuibacillus multivorans]GEL78742.1 nitrogen regulatory protein P-II [Tenuibacillus multivorans]SDN79709.1 Nitrogen regulatory protein PII [Tenuibacillus multivorans]